MSSNLIYILVRWSVTVRKPYHRYTEVVALNHIDVILFIRAVDRFVGKKPCLRELYIMVQW